MWSLHDLVDEARRLVALPSHRDPAPVLAYLTRRLPFLPWQWQAVGTNPYGRPLHNLFARPPGALMVVNTHVDTVPPLGMRRPFAARLRQGRLFGRGAVDTKGLLAALVVAANAFHRQHGHLPVALAFTGDEETTAALGSQTLAPLVRTWGPVLVLEPTQGCVCTGQAGALEFRLTAQGRVVHAAAFQQGVNPLRLLTRLAEAVEPTLGLPLNLLHLRGGWEHYAVPPRAALLAEIPVPAGHTWAQVERDLQRLLARPPWHGRVTYTRVDASDPLDFGTHAGTRWLRAAYRVALGREPATGIMPSWTDAANFAQAGARCVVFGFGDLAVAHSPQEHITLEDLDHMARVLYHLFSILTQNPSEIGWKPKPR